MHVPSRAATSTAPPLPPQAPHPPAQPPTVVAMLPPPDVQQQPEQQAHRHQPGRLPTTTCNSTVGTGGVEQTVARLQHWGSNTNRARSICRHCPNLLATTSTNVTSQGKYGANQGLYISNTNNEKGKAPASSSTSNNPSQK